MRQWLSWIEQRPSSMWGKWKTRYSLAIEFISSSLVIGTISRGSGVRVPPDVPASYEAFLFSCSLFYGVSDNPKQHLWLNVV